MLIYTLKRLALRDAGGDRRQHHLLSPRPHRAGRSALRDPAGRRDPGAGRADARRLRLRQAAAGAIRAVVLAGRARRSRHLDRDRPRGRERSHARGRQHPDPRHRGDRDRLHLRRVLRLRRRLFPRLLARQARLAGVGARRERAALLARHGAGHHLLGRAQLAAADRRRAGRLGRLAPRRRASALHHPAGHHHVGHPDGRHRAHRAGAGRRHPRPGIRPGAARQGPARVRRIPPRRRPTRRRPRSP